MTATAMVSSAAGLRLVSASAGSGKTYRLTEAVTSAVAPSGSAPIEIESLVGVTYTTKAHIELQARIRRKLVEHKAFERAQRLPLAYVGTVHAVCLRILKEFALDAGLSPTVDVIPRNEGRRLLQAALEQALDPAMHQRLEELARGFELELIQRTGRIDWIFPVDEIMTLARSNRIAPRELTWMARRSIEGLLSLFPPQDPSADKLESDLALSIATTIETLAGFDDDTQLTRKALAELRLAASQLAVDRLPWPAWASLAALAPSKRATPLIIQVREAASVYERHPRFRAELRELTELLFEAARVGLVAYANWKAQRGLVDYVDMIEASFRSARME